MLPDGSGRPCCLSGSLKSQCGISIFFIFLWFFHHVCMKNVDLEKCFQNLFRLFFLLLQCLTFQLWAMTMGASIFLLLCDSQTKTDEYHWYQMKDLTLQQKIQICFTDIIKISKKRKHKHIGTWRIIQWHHRCKNLLSIYVPILTMDIATKATLYSYRQA